VPGSVLWPWVEQLPWKQQSILFSGLRGPDQDHLRAIKQVSKWMRAVSQRNADPTKGYMNEPHGLVGPPTRGPRVLKGVVVPELRDLEKELEHSSCHFVHHLADALAVIAYGHPEREVRKYAFSVHAYIAEEIFHFVPEHPRIFDWRHRDKQDGLDSTPDKPFDDRQWMHDLLQEGYVHG
jgi:hypothetical protein